MQIVIDIPEELVNELNDYNYQKIISWCDTTLYVAIKNGTQLPKGYGRLIDADKCIKQAWNDFYKHEDEWEKKDKDYLPFGRFYDQNGFECCLKTILNSPTIIEVDKTESEVKDVTTSPVHDKREPVVDILKSEIAKISYELNRIVNELHALNRKK